MLGFPIGGTTIGTHYSEGNKVRLTVNVGQAPDPTEGQFVKVAETINQIIESNKPVYILKLARADAEGKYKNAMYNKHAVSRSLSPSLNLQVLPIFIAYVYHVPPYRFLKQ